MGARMRRLLLLCAVVLGLAPGTFLRTPTGLSWDKAVVSVTARAERDGASGPLRLTGVWELQSDHNWVGGFSALAPSSGPDGRAALIAGSDNGFRLDLDLADGAPRAVPDSFRFIGFRTRGRREYVDLESLTRDPATGTLWGGFEYFNLIIRYAPDGTRVVRAPPAMAGWSANSGSETMVRLADGRFLVIEEGSHEKGSRLHQALVFPGDPTAGGVPVIAYLAAPEDYSPVDAAQLPDGRLVILLRRVRYFLPARFDTAIMIADPRAIRAGGVLQGRIIERLEAGILADNFEGIAYVPAPGDPVRGSLWLISDNNFSVFQRSLLIRFDWPGDAGVTVAP